MGYYIEAPPLTPDLAAWILANEPTAQRVNSADLQRAQVEQLGIVTITTDAEGKEVANFAHSNTSFGNLDREDKAAGTTRTWLVMDRAAALRLTGVDEPLITR